MVFGGYRNGLGVRKWLRWWHLPVVPSGKLHLLRVPLPRAHAETLTADDSLQNMEAQLFDRCETMSTNHPQKAGTVVKPQQQVKSSVG